MKYVEISLTEAPVFARNEIISEVVAAVHRHASGTIAIAFPGMTETHTGDTVRLFCESGEYLSSFMRLPEVTSLMETVEVAGGVVSPVWEAAESETHHIYIRDRRHERPHSMSRMRRMDRLGLEIKEPVQKTRKPFVRVKSQSNTRSFAIYISRHAVSTAVSGKVGSYGFSSMSPDHPKMSVPHF